MKELLSGETTDGERIRRSGAERKTVEEIYPDIIGLTKEILDDETYGSPEGGISRIPGQNIVRPILPAAFVTI